jgi:hypothetical protein
MILHFLGSPNSVGTIVLVTVLVVSGLQLLVAVRFDMESNTELR